MAKRVVVGLDIGSSAVRAAEVVHERGGSALRRFGQVGLPRGAVVEGEIRDPGVVVEALKRLWAEAGISSKHVVLGMGSQRVMVRQIEMPALGDSELRSSLRYAIGELLPIPVEQAVFDFSVIGPAISRPDGSAGTEVLVVAAQRDIVSETIGVVGRAGLRVKAVDASALALMRAVADGGGGGMEAIISFGAQLVVVTVREDGIPRFVRTVTAGSESVTASLAAALSVSSDQAEVAKRDRTASPRSAVGSGISSAIEPMVDDVTGSLDFFLSHSQGGRLARAVITGGGARLPLLSERLSSALRVPVEPATMSLNTDLVEAELTGEQLEQASYQWTTAVGLALWGNDGRHSPSLLPTEVRHKSQHRRTMLMAGAGVAAVAVVLAGVSVTQVREEHSIQSSINAKDAQIAAEQANVTRLEAITRVSGEVSAQRALATTALSGDVDWVGLLGAISQAVPSATKVTSINLAKVAAAAGQTSPFVGTISMTAETSQGAPGVSAFIQALSGVKDLGALWVSSSVIGKDGVTHFEATAGITKAALGLRAKNLPGGKR